MIHLLPEKTNRRNANLLDVNRKHGIVVHIFFYPLNLRVRQPITEPTQYNATCGASSLKIILDLYGIMALVKYLSG